MNATFFWEAQYIEEVSKIYSFFPWRSPSSTFYLSNVGKYRKIRYFEKWGDFEEKVERQGKGDQIVCNEPIDAHLSP